MMTQSDNDLAISIQGRFFRTGSLRDEPYEYVTEPQAVIAKLKRDAIRADLFTFIQPVPDTTPKYPFRFEYDQLAVLPISTYKHWFDEEIGFKARNKVRKAEKAGAKIRRMEMDDDCIRGIMGIYNESPLIQGRHNWHYGKDFST